MKTYSLLLFLVCVLVWPTSPSAAPALAADDGLGAVPTPPPVVPPADDAEPFPEGVVVEEVRKGLAGDMAGLRPGDVLLAWSLTTGESSGAEPRERSIRSPFDLTEVDLEQVPRWPVRLRGVRAGEPLSVVVPAEGGLWVEVRPALPQPLFASYHRGAAFVNEGKVQEGTALWRQAASTAGEARGGQHARCWLLGRIGSALAKPSTAESRNAYQDAVACGETLGNLAAAVILEDQGRAEWTTGHVQEAVEAYTAALKVREAARSSALARARSLLNVAQLANAQGQAERAIGIYGDLVSALEAEAPRSLTLAAALTWWGLSLSTSGDMDGAEAALARARDIAEATSPIEGPALVGILTGQGGLAQTRGDLAGAAHLWRRASDIAYRLDPNGLQSGIARLNLGDLAMTRGDLAGAEAWFRSALLIAGEAGGQRGLLALLLHNLGEVAGARGDFVAAEDLLRRALKEFETLAPGGLRVAQTLRTLGATLRRRGDRNAAWTTLRRALDLGERLAPDGTLTAEALLSLGDLATVEANWPVAEDCYSRARVILERLAPANARLAQVLHGLGAVQLARGDVNEAEFLFSTAVRNLEAQRPRLGASDEARSLLNSRFFGLYQAQIKLLVGKGRLSEAFDVLERSRARSLLTLIAERDLVFESEVPAEVERERRRVGAEYERTRAKLDSLGGQKDDAEIARLISRLRELRDKQNGIADQIRQASPRLADLRDPLPLDAEGVRASLDPGTAFLAYSVGKEKTLLFVLTAADPEVRVVFVPLGEADLRKQVDRWRRLTEQTVPPIEFSRQAKALYDLLLRPAEPYFRTSERLLVSPDGPLHQLPFAALRRGNRYLAEWKPLSLVPSGTLYAQLARARKPGAYAIDFEAFGDPRAANLDPLPATRHEVEAIARLFPRAALHLGDQATEGRAKALGKGVRYVHFASHGLIDDHLPLDSALALSAPREPGEEGENGRLHAWEVIERVRLDADLVTLSACRSAAGTELAGEGMIGLTRAFQYAGARSVLASLWRIGDRSTADLMKSVYGLLKAGLPKDEALRRAQVRAIRQGWHPARWAAFQLYGDWSPAATAGAELEVGSSVAAAPAAGPRGGLRLRPPANRSPR